MQTAIYLTKEKFEALTKELDDLKTNKRREIAQSLEYARSLGDLSENAEYQEAREAQATIENRIAIIENTLKQAHGVEEDRHAIGTVGMGSVVTVKKQGGNGEQSFTLVGSEESNAHNGKISNTSPMGTALIDKKKGDLITVNTPKGETVYKIVSVS